jgi:ABC-type glutathione transport system ATPase component
MTPALKTHDLAVGYGRQSVLSHINLAVAPGELVCLLGVNGIGKSTLMRTLAWMQPALGGSVEIDGRDISRMNQGELARKVAVVLTERWWRWGVTRIPGGRGSFRTRTAILSRRRLRQSARSIWRNAISMSFRMASGSAS